MAVDRGDNDNFFIKFCYHYHLILLYSNDKVCLEINGNYNSSKNLFLLLHTDISDIYYDKENNDTFEIFKAKY